MSPTTSCVPDEGDYPNTLAEGRGRWSNKDRVYGGRKVPCIDGKQTWGTMAYPGVPVNIPYEDREYGMAARFGVRPHLSLGFVGLAPDTRGVPVASIAPGRTGGALAQRHVTVGSKIYLPVELKGAQLFLGDGNLAAHDSHFTGCGIEGHLEAEIRIVLHRRKDRTTKKWMRTMEAPIVETPKAWIVQARVCAHCCDLLYRIPFLSLCGTQGLAYPDYLRQLPEPAQTAVLAAGKNLNRAMSAAANATREFIMAEYECVFPG